VVGPDGDGRFARRVSGRETVELSARMSEDDVAIGHDRAGTRFLARGDDDRVDAVLGEKPSNAAQACVGSAGDDPCVHDTSDGLVRLCRLRAHPGIVEVLGIRSVLVRRWLP
jgi:hypothetical protein